MITRTGYIFIGSTQYETDIALPYPSVGSAAFGQESQYESERNANGVLVGQQLGAPIITHEMEWQRIDPEYWWQITRFFEENGDAFWCRFFNHMAGEWQVKQFVKSSLHCNPMRVSLETGEPKYYADAGFTIESIGD